MSYLCLGCGRKVEPREGLVRGHTHCRECGSIMLVEEHVFNKILRQVVEGNPINWRERPTEIGKTIFARIEAFMARLREEGVTFRPIRSRFIIERILEQL